MNKPTKVAHKATVATTNHADRIRAVVSPLGIEAWLVEDYTVPIIAVEGLIEGGTSQDPADRPGLLHCLMGTLDEGAGPYDSTAFQERLDDFAIELSFGADRDHASFHLRTLARHRDEAFDMLRLALTEARLDSDSVERVRAQIIAGLRHESTDPDVMAHRAWFATAFAGHPYGRSSKGTLDSVPEITRADLDHTRTTLLTRSKLHLVVVGAIDPDSLARMLDEVFGPLPALSGVKPVASMLPEAVGTRKVIDLDVPQASIRFGAAGLARTDPDFVAATVVNHILGGGVFSSRLFREVREKRGLAYSVSSHLAPFAHGPLYMGGTSTKNERAAESIAIIEQELTSLAHDGPNEQELATAKNYLIGSYALRLDTSAKLASQLVHIKAHGLGRSYLDERNGLVAAVSLDDAVRTAKRLYGAGDLLTVVVGRPVGL